MPRLVLLGDSILDNASYTFPGPDTERHEGPAAQVIAPGRARVGGSESLPLLRDS